MLADAAAGVPAGRRDRRDRQLPRPLDDRARRGAHPRASTVVAIDPHAGNDRGPGRDRRLRRRGGRRPGGVRAPTWPPPACADRVRHVRRVLRRRPRRTSTARSTCSTSTAPTAIGPARADLRDWGARVADGGDAADPRRVLVDRRHAGDRPRAGARPPVPLRRPVPLAGRVPRRPRRPGRVGRAAQRRPPAGPARVVRPQRRPQGAPHARRRQAARAASAAPCPEWPY